ncbi:MAG: hypothetical protein KC464_21170, partial [Myxococcales bacterium]|nr:hypothetical protein [Myxococcales bacterium]
MDRIAQRRIQRVDTRTGARTADRDPVIAEAALTICARGREAMVVMRTPGPPGEDAELVRGLLHAEGVADAVALAIRQVEADVVEVDLDPATLAPRALTSTA